MGRRRLISVDGQKEGRAKGREEGQAEGLQADKEEIRRCMAQAMKVEDVSVEMIIETTDLSADELAAL